MDSAVVAWVADYGAPFVFFGTFLSCLGLPIPAAIIMLAGGAAVALDGAALVPFLLAAYAGAVLAGTGIFALARRHGGSVVSRLERRPAWGAVIARAHKRVENWGGFAVFLGSCFVAQLGPAVNVVSGAAGLRWTTFNANHLTGRGIWVTGYLGLGFYFSDSIRDVAYLFSNLSWFVAGTLLLVGTFTLYRWRR